MIYVRRFLPIDIGPVMDMAKAFHAESPIHRQHPFSEKRVIELLTVARASEDWLALTATDDDAQLTGFALVTVQPMFYSDARELLDLAVYVSKDRRGWRTFKALMEEIETWAKGQDAVMGQFGINTGINPEAALKSFEKLGWTATGAVITKAL